MMTEDQAVAARSFDQDDPAFGAAFVDVDEWRETPLPHRYLHGGFRGGETRFSMYLPEHGAYRGRMVQELPGGLAGSEMLPPEYLGRLLPGVFGLGAFLVTSNQGWILTAARPGFGGPGLPQDPSVLSHRASAQTARFAKATAEQLLGSRPDHAYLIGGSGGGARSVACMEQVPGLWDGAVPMVMVNQHLAWHLWSVWTRAEAGLRHKKQEIIEAVDAGSDPFSVLDGDEERELLADLYSAGYPKRAEQLLSWMAADWSPTWITHTDPGYVEDFWTVSGYAGKDQQRIRTTATVTELIRAADPEGPALLLALPESVRGLVPANTIVGVRLSGVDVSSDLIGCRFTVGMPGAEVLRMCTAVTGACIGFADTSLLQPADPGCPALKPGDVIDLDSAIAQSWPYYHRHVIDPERPTMQRWVDEGKPVWPQRPVDAERRSMIAALPTGQFDGKMIIVQTALDHLTPPIFAQDYVELVRSHVGDSEDRIRLWILDNAMHGDPFPEMGVSALLRFVSFLGAALQALADLVAWVEDGVAPPASTGYELDGWNQTVLAPTAAARAGIQPLVAIDGPIEARAGESVTLTASVEVPPGGGSVVEAAWDLDGSGSFEHAVEVEQPAPTLKTAVEHRFTEAGTHLAVLRVASHRQGDPADPVRFVYNLARLQVRVVGER